MRFILLLLSISIIYSCSTQKTENQARYDQLIISEERGVIKFDTSFFERIATNYLIAGSMKQQQEDYAAAILEFQEALKYDSSAAILYAIGKSYLELGKYEKSKEYLIVATKKNPEFVPAYDLLTEIYLFNNEIQKAHITNNRAYELEPNTDRKVTKAYTLEKSDPEKALEIYNSIDSPGYSDLIVERKSHLYNVLNRSDDYIKELKKKQEIEPFNFNISRKIFESYLDNRQLDSALNYLNTVDTLFYGQEQETYYIIFARYLITSNPIDTTVAEKFLSQLDDNLLFDEDITFFSGIVAIRTGNDGKRDELFNRTLKISDENSDLKFGIAESYYNAQEYERSLELLNEIEKDSIIKQPEYHVLKGLSNYMLKNYDKAIENYWQVWEIDSTYNNYSALTMIGECYDVQGEIDSAIHYYERHFSLDSNNTLLLNNYAYSLSRLEKDLDRALEMSKKTLERDPGNSAYLDTYGWILYKMKRYDEALEYINRSVETGDASAEVLEHLGDVYLKLDEKQKALDAYKKANELESDREGLSEKINELTKD